MRSWRSGSWRYIKQLIQPKDIREERERYEKALETLQAAEKRIKRDPEFGRMVASKTNTDKVVIHLNYAVL
jgi:hypothetical protein